MATTAQVYQLYLAYFGRPPDFTGLNSFANSSPAQVQAIFSASAESRALIGSSDTATQVNNIYQNLFGRDAEPAGLAYWVNEIASGRVTLASAAFDILNGARNADATVVANRIEVAQAFVANYSATTAGILGYVGDAAAAQARTFLRTVTDTAASKTAALASVAAAVTSTVAAGTSAAGAGTVGSSFTLSTAVETTAGTANNDTFAATTTNTGATLTDGDVINAGSGTDTLSIAAQGAAATVFLNSVENVSVRLLSAQSFDAIGWSGTTNVTVNSESLNDLSLTVTNAAFSTTFGVNDDANLEVNYLDVSGSADTALLAVSGGGVSGSAAILDVGSATGGIEAVSLAVAGINYVTVEAGASATAITVAGTGTLELTTNDTIGVLSLAGFSGSSTVTLQGISNVSVTGGAGADTFALGGTFNSNDTINGGAGSDVLTIVNTNANQTFGNVSNVESMRASFSGSVATLGLSGASFTTVSLTNGSSTDITLNDIGANVTVDVQNDDAALGGSLTLDYQAGRTATMSFAAGTAAATLGAVSITDAASVAITSTGGSGTKTFGDLTLDSDATTVRLTAGGSASMVFASGSLAADGATSITLTAGGSASLTFDEAVLATAGSLTSISLVATGDDDNDLRFGSGNLGATTNVAASATLTFAASATDGAGIYVDGITGKSSTYNVAVTLGAGSDFGDFSAGNVGPSGMAIADAANAGVLNSFVVVAGASAYAQFDDINMGSASGSVSDISLTNGASGYTNLHDVIAKTIGNVTIVGGGSATIDALEASTVGNISISNAEGATLTKVGSATSTVGNIAVSSSVKEDVTIAALQASAIGSITLSAQSGTTSIGSQTVAVSATTLTSVDASGMSAGASLVLNLAGVVNGTTITLGAGTNSVFSTDGDDIITLAAGTGNDTITFLTTADGNDTISRFDFTSGEDVIRFGSAVDNRDFYSGSTFTSGTMTVQLVSAAATLASSTQVVVLRSGTFGTISDLLSAIATAGTLELSAADTTSAGNEITVVWSDGVDSYVTLISLSSAVASGTNGVFQTNDATQVIATLSNVNVAAISADQLQAHFTAL